MITVGINSRQNQISQYNRRRRPQTPHSANGIFYVRKANTHQGTSPLSEKSDTATGILRLHDLIHTSARTTCRQTGITMTQQKIPAPHLMLQTIIHNFSIVIWSSP
ncbi:hypothetical protein NKW55_10815 [Gluconobacter kondonii]|uniref:hypothetical protein n=1 Tax=Gluconobacter kondonii TaxID=941463 RepID=UPI00209D6F5C|nr:hypothetical protein [Gluconobacter kondonii]MCP1237093.1 hypothetical protein [Gluconobacter kondonii]